MFFTSSRIHTRSGADLVATDRQMKHPNEPPSY
jgi:hypothetical protein